jgi:hypothetical protein
MLDNFTPQEIARRGPHPAVQPCKQSPLTPALALTRTLAPCDPCCGRDAQLFKEKYPHVVVEASGGITAETITGFLTPHVDVISQGSLTQGYGVLDFSMKLPRPQGWVGGGQAVKSKL